MAGFKLQVLLQASKASNLATMASRRVARGMISLGFLKILRAGLVAYRDKGLRKSPRIAMDFGIQIAHPSITYRDAPSCGPLRTGMGP
ncbi:hypothetical protein E3N88_35132 [Mikania micrantha]|uniref:Uncharacterized protein n=1 Tax=Mikania micrantha TaxID=192012 RepID=A0A5N6M0I1_9ASTR|nr:hypothetical protein E3N88_35132 [Mikania micrantha]